MRVSKSLFGKLRLSLLLLALVVLYASAGFAGGQRTSGAAARPTAPTPKDVLGFTPGDDYKLASWAQFVDYFKKLDAASDRVLFEELGKTTLGRPFVLATISSPANLGRLDTFKEIQRQLADPRTLRSNDGEAARLMRDGRTIVLITCGIHSTEVGANLVSMNIAHRLASSTEPEVLEILDKTIILLVPSLNPDGIDIVKNWYDKTVKTPAEGSTPPELYHHYTGHDNNRDWYAFTQVETQLTVDKIHNVWRPQIVHDIHQQGASGSRFFVPPYHEPWEPNVPPLIQAGVNFMGTSIAWEMTNEGKAGVVINGVYDAWTPARAYQHYHAGIRILSETASANLASPINIAFERQTPQLNVDTKKRSWNYPLVWQGGDWKLADIVEYQRAGAFALLRNAARYRERWLQGFYQIGKEAVRERQSGELFAYLMPPVDSANEWRVSGFLQATGILQRGGVEMFEASAAFEAGGKTYPAGTLIVPMAQPYGAFAKTLLERQQYPDLRQYPGGPPVRPYDVTAHTLPLLMGVNAVAVDKPFAMPKTLARRTSLRHTPRPGTARVGLYKSYAASMDEGWTRWILDQYRGKVTHSSLLDAEIRAGNLRAKYDAIIFPEQSARAIVEGLSAARYPQEFAGGIGKEGVEALKKFVEEGGAIVTLNDASELAVEHLGAPVKNVLAGVRAQDFYCPGSILKIKFDPASDLTQGVPTLAGTTDESIAWFETSPAYEVTGAGAKVIARYGDANELLLSGWLLGGEKIAGKAAIVEVTRGKGRIVMFAFRPQYRGQSVATLPFLFNAIMTGGGSR